MKTPGHKVSPISWIPRNAISFSTSPR